MLIVEIGDDIILIDIIWEGWMSVTPTFTKMQRSETDRLTDRQITIQKERQTGRQAHRQT